RSGIHDPASSGPVEQRMAWDVGIPQDDPCAIRHGPRLAALPQPAPVAGCQTCGRFVSARSTRAENSPYADTMPPLALPAILHLARPEERRHARGVRRGGEPRDARGPRSEERRVGKEGGG